MVDEPVSPGGSTIHIHRQAAPFESPPVEGLFLAEIQAHLEPLLGKNDFVLHEIISDKVHLDVMQFKPTAERPWWTFVTSGMSDRPMAVPEDVPGRETLDRAELVISFPGEWSIPWGAHTIVGGQEEPERSDQEERWWPIAWMKFLARLPHEYGTWLGRGHTVPNGDPPVPLGTNTKMSGAVLAPPVTWPQDYWQLKSANGTVISFWAVYPLYGDEMTFKLNKGYDALIGLFEKHTLTEVLNPERPSMVAKRRWWV